MRKPKGYEEAETFDGESLQVPHGKYELIIRKVWLDVSKKGDDLLYIGYDINQGDFKGIYSKKYQAMKESPYGTSKKWVVIATRCFSVSDNSQGLPFFKGFIKAIENSNEGFIWDWDENDLIGKVFGGVLGQEEVMLNDGKVVICTKLSKIRSLDKLDEAEVPPLKKLETEVKNKMEEQKAITEEDIPF